MGMDSTIVRECVRPRLVKMEDSFSSQCATCSVTATSGKTKQTKTKQRQPPCPTVDFVKTNGDVVVCMNVGELKPPASGYH